MPAKGTKLKYIDTDNSLKSSTNRLESIQIETQIVSQPIITKKITNEIVIDNQGPLETQDSNCHSVLSEQERDAGLRSKI